MNTLRHILLALILFLSLWLLCLPASALAQLHPPILWQQTYGGRQLGYAALINYGFLSDGRFIACPSSIYFPYQTAIFSWQGEMLTTSEDYFNAQIIANDNEFYGTELPDMTHRIITKRNSNLEVEWIFDPNVDSGTGLMSLNHEGDVVATYYSGPDMEHYEASIVRFAPDGTILEHFTVNHDYGIWAVGVLQLRNGLYFLYGVEVQEITNRYSFIATVDNNGNILSMNYLDGYQVGATAHVFTELPDGRILLAPRLNPMAPLQDLYYFDNNGEMTGSQNYNAFLPEDHDSYFPVLMDDGGFLVRDLYPSGYSLPVYRINARGELVWYNDYNPGFSDDVHVLNILPFHQERFLCTGFYTVFWNNGYSSANQFFLAALGPDTVPIRIRAAQVEPGEPVTAGTWLEWQGRISNFGGDAKQGDVWVDLRDPLGNLIAQVEYRDDVTIPPHYHYDAQVTTFIPDDALPGDYNLLLRIGDFPDFAYQDWFSFTVEAPTLSQSTERSEGWRSQIRGFRRLPFQADQPGTESTDTHP